MTIDGTAYELDANAMNSYTWETANTAVATMIHSTRMVLMCLFHSGESTANVNNWLMSMQWAARMIPFGSSTLLCQGCAGRPALRALMF